MIYLTNDSNKGVFFQRFHNWKLIDLNKDDYLPIIGDTGLSSDEAYESYYRLEWFDGEPYTTLVAPENVTEEERDRAFWNGGKASFIRTSIIRLYGNQIYEIDNLKFLVLNEASKLDDLVNLEVDYILATSLEAFETVKNKIKLKYCYIGESNKAMPDGSVILLDEDIQEIMSI